MKLKWDVKYAQMVAGTIVMMAVNTLVPVDVKMVVVDVIINVPEVVKVLVMEVVKI